MKRDDENTTTKASNNRAVSFPLGRLLITPGALNLLTHDETFRALDRHSRGDWGECCPHDAAENDFALDKYLRLFSVYRSEAGTKFWIITEADRSATTILLPDEY
jgi:hypothetical protein